MKIVSNLFSILNAMFQDEADKAEVEDEDVRGARQAGTDVERHVQTQVYIS